MKRKHRTRTHDPQASAKMQCTVPRNTPDMAALISLFHFGHFVHAVSPKYIEQKPLRPVGHNLCAQATEKQTCASVRRRVSACCHGIPTLTLNPDRHSSHCRHTRTHTTPTIRHNTTTARERRIDARRQHVESATESHQAAVSSCCRRARRRRRRVVVASSTQPQR